MMTSNQTRWAIDGSPLRPTAFTFIVCGLLLLLAALLVNGRAVAQEDTVTGSPLHPTFALLDAAGVSVLESGAPVSTMQTCGSCHDTAFIAGHSIHADVGQTPTGQTEFARAWQTGIGWFGGWNPLSYDTTDNITGWIQSFGWRHVGGGPAAEAGVEMNCFLCHMAEPNNAARITALTGGDFEWASTATLDGTGIVRAGADGWQYESAAFVDGLLRPEFVPIGAPRDANCGLCHGVADESTQIALSFDPFDPAQWQTYTTGQVFSPQRLSNTGLNLAGKSELARSWDVHAERAVDCVDCHYALNNPVFYVEPAASRPDHLQFDPRRMDFGDYLERPLHQFANGGGAYAGAFPVFERAERDCATCHDAVSTHTWLEYPARHMQVLACETCHVPQTFAPAVESVDWTVVNADGSPQTGFRGADTTAEPALLTGYTPLLLPDQHGQLAPYNLVSAWYWVADGQPVPVETVRAAYFDGDDYAAAVLDLFDGDGDGTLSATERVIDSDAKTSLIVERLAGQGAADAHIVAEVERYPLHHNVTQGEWATRTCSTCHREDSRLALPISLSDRTPGGVLPTLMGDFGGQIETGANGALLFTPDAAPVNLYVLGHNRVDLVNQIGLGLLVLTMLAVLGHGGLRYVMLRRTPPPADPELRAVYMYGIYERQWHWLQTAVIFGLLFTGLVIHKPDMFPALSFRWVVLLHNAFALILVVNAALAAFYHLASGEIRQFIPEPRGFFGQMFAQARYYAYGIFRGEPHPFEKTRQHKLNPIQQVTYFGLLNVLLPLQVITGALMWGAQHWPGVTAALGGLTLLAPFHTLVAWLLLSFIVLHVYMTTTGHTPLANVRAMMLGWDEVEAHSPLAGD